MHTLTRRVATVATTGALILGGAVATASTASAATVGSGACTHQIKLNTDVYTTVKFRTGPAPATPPPASSPGVPTCTGSATRATTASPVPGATSP